MLTGINHITLAVRDLEQSLAFYVDTLACRLVAKWPHGAYLLAGDIWLALIVDPQAREQALPEYTHIAWHVPASEFGDAAQQIQSSGAKIWKTNSSEGDSLYFEDPNGHKLEIHSSNLKARIHSALKSPWADLEIYMRAHEL